MDERAESEEVKYKIIEIPVQYYLNIYLCKDGNLDNMNKLKKTKRITLTF